MRLLQTASVSGSAFVKTFAEGIDKEFLTLYKKVAGNNAKLMNLFPQSDAKEGPFRNLSKSGSSLVVTFLSGIERAKSKLFSSLFNIMNDAKGFINFQTLGDIQFKLDNPIPLEKVLKSGEGIVKTLAQGVKNSANTLYDAIKVVFQKSWKLFTQSDAKEGPFSKMTYSGQSLIRTFSLGAESESPRLYTTLERSFGNANAIIQKENEPILKRSEPSQVSPTTNSSNVLNFEYFIKEFNLSGESSESNFNFARMILFMEHELLIESNPIKRVERVELEMSRDVPAASMKVRLSVKNNDDVYNIKQGDFVIWKAGYKRKDSIFTELIEEFRGIITEITPTRPLEFIAKDKMFLLSLKKMNQNFPTLTVTSYVQRILDECGVSALLKVDSSVANKQVIENIVGHSGRYALWKLRDPKYGCDVYFKGNTLHIENQYDKKNKEPTAFFAFNHTIISSTLGGRGFKSDFGKKKSFSTSMLKRLGDEIQVEIVSEDTKTGVIRKATHGTGSNKKIYYMDNLDQNEIQKKAKEIFNELTGEGFTGSFTTFGYPSVNANDVIYIEDSENEQMSGTCIVEKVNKTYDVSNANYRQVIYPGRFTEPPKRSQFKVPTKANVNPTQTEPTPETIVDKIHRKFYDLKDKFKSIKIL